ncbi:hypothetical protein SAMN05443634_106110 [Chishuiella changwenlii]|uniref:Uncharacterized protein n=1 Tax=Chishuiella changwenlii TaxID=1434701 RepID=A0A1M6Y6H7_9FLAO|nr:hypothetical protein [Chishuiella changwenlii]GGE93357.1 hypothetical protein GCM10010984_08730 [Chishuiella changwenlii]SHL13856.1 hypothetical protein SAMN05443634_106110 [Chishuiella changwenlii]
MKNIFNIYLVFFAFVYGCTVNKNTDISFVNISNQTDEDKKIEKWYYENTPKEYNKKEDEILVFFSGQAFKGSEIIVNKKDTLKFKEESNPLECLGYKMYIIKKNAKFLYVISEKKQEKLKLKLNNNYDYLIVGNSLHNLWGVVYYPFFPNITCR